MTEIGASTCLTFLADSNRWHSVSIGRPSRYTHTLLVDEQHLATANIKGPNLHLDLDGILFLGSLSQSC